MMGTKVYKANVTVCTDYVTKDSKEIEKILNRVSEIINRSHRRMMSEGEAQ